ncbi:MAG: HD-GYP domain-containing protein [Betaproteobacteria bacterium]|nr:HD-GYP domain-containing protein [Betaproteobacteria bacterium]
MRRFLAWRLGVAGLIIGLAGGATSYWLETYRFETLAWDHAASGARHFATPAMQALLDGEEEHHAELTALLDRTRFVGIRVFRPDMATAFEAWAKIPPALIAASRSTSLDWPATGQSRRLRVDFDGERLILVRLPLTANDGRLVGYIDGVTRVDGEAVDVQRQHARTAALISVTSVGLATFLLYPMMLALLRRSSELSRNLLNSNLSLLRSLGNAVAKRDSDTDAHNYRVTLYAVGLAEHMGLPRSDIANLVTGAFLHDVGKIGIPDSILLKPGRLTQGEWEVMTTHVRLGLEIVADNPWLDGAALTIAQHHEHFDGEGYPQGLRAKDIALVARVFAIVDVFDALTSERPYRRPLPLAEALDVIASDSGRHFDPSAVEAFQRVAPAMFQVISAADIDRLRTMLREALTRYFDSRVAV